MNNKNEMNSISNMTDEELDALFKEAVSHDIEERIAKGLPNAGYDSRTKKAYLEYPDGRRIYIRSK